MNCVFRTQSPNHQQHRIPRGSAGSRHRWAERRHDDGRRVQLASLAPPSISLHPPPRVTARHVTPDPTPGRHFSQNPTQSGATKDPAPGPTGQARHDEFSPRHRAYCHRGGGDKTGQNQPEIWSGSIRRGPTTGGRHRRWGWDLGASAGCRHG